MPTRSLLAQSALALLLFAGCDGEGPTAVEEVGGEEIPKVENQDTVRAPSAAHGLMAISQSCAACHVDSDGFDLAYFGFSDTDILRRARGHVDEQSAQDIVALVRSYRDRIATPETRLLQPTGVILGSDAEFANRLFGADEWPADMSSAKLRALDLRKIAVAVPFPLWSDEGSNQDWLPDAPLPEHILDFNGGKARAALATYRKSPTISTLYMAVYALAVAERDPANPSAPCLFGTDRVQFDQCLEIRRWVATLTAQHMIRHGLGPDLDPLFSDTWWDVGYVGRRSIDAKMPIPNAEAIWISWMYLGWTHDAHRVSSSGYIGTGLVNVGLPRHATFAVLRTMVDRGSGLVSPYEDIYHAARLAPKGWTYAAMRFAYGHLLERIRAGDVPATAELTNQARSYLNVSLQYGSSKLTPSQTAELTELAQEISASLQ